MCQMFNARLMSVSKFYCDLQFSKSLSGAYCFLRVALNHLANQFPLFKWDGECTISIAINTFPLPIVGPVDSSSSAMRRYLQAVGIAK